MIDSSTGRGEKMIYKIGMVIVRLGLAYLFFTQTWWKLPPTFGCSNNYAFPKPAAGNTYDANGSSGLCYWMGLESLYASQPRPVLIADMRAGGLPALSVDIAPLARMNGSLLDNVFIPNIRIFGWLVWLSEFWIAISLVLGLFTRFGGLVAMGMSIQLYVGLANIPRPFEWEWSYGAMVLLSIAMFAATPGRYFGVDAWLRKLVNGPSLRGKLLAKLILLLS
jgi:uncharacterized membrane protein YphA (DoxX/SURF4 family)